jgi:hypothetical protein
MSSDRTILCLSYLNGQFKAMALHRGVPAGKWERPEPLDSFENFSAIIEEAVRETGFRGSQASLILAHPRLTHQFLETPPAKGAALERYARRRADQLKPFEAQAAVSFQPTLPPKRGQGLLLHLFPRPFVEQLFKGCEEAGLHLVQVFPIPAVLMNQLRHLPLEGEEVALLAAETAGSTTVLIGRKDGQVLLGRSLTSSWNSNPDRVVVDLHRTILYVEQQFGAAVNRVWLFGAGAAEHVAVMQPMVKVPVQVSPVPSNPFYWIYQGQKLAPDNPNNLVGQDLRNAPQRKLFMRTTALLVAALLVVALLVSGYIEMMVRSQKSALQELKPKAVQLQDQRKEWQVRYDSLGKQQEWIRLVTERKAPPVPAWFLTYLGEIFPEQLVLTHLQVKRVDDFWAVQLGGTAQAAPGDSPEAALDSGVKALTSRLAGSPFHVTLAGAGGLKPAAAPKPGSGRAAPAIVSGREFFIEGTMQ